MSVTCKCSMCLILILSPNVTLLLTYQLHGVQIGTHILCKRIFQKRILKHICIVFPPAEGRAGVGHKSLALTESVCAVWRWREALRWRETWRWREAVSIQKLSLVSQLQPQKTSPSGRGQTWRTARTGRPPLQCIHPPSNRERGWRWRAKHVLGHFAADLDGSKTFWVNLRQDESDRKDLGHLTTSEAATNSLRVRKSLPETWEARRGKYFEKFSGEEALTTCRGWTGSHRRGRTGQVATSPHQTVTAEKMRYVQLRL